MKTLTTLGLALLTAVSLQAELVEKKLYTTDFQDWDAFSASAAGATIDKTVTTKDKQSLTLSFSEVGVDPTGTEGKFINTEVITPGFAKAVKSLTAHIETSVLKSVTKVTYVHAATGSNRGWGLLCKTADATQWDTLHSTCCEQAGTLVSVDVNRENVQLRWYNLAPQYAFMTEFTVFGNVEVAPRTFTDFEIDLTQNPPVLPEGVQGAGASYNGAQHGWVDYQIGFKTDGPVRITFGGCQYANKNATVTSGTTGALLATVDTKSCGCYHNGGTATWTYNVEAADSLIVYCGQYCPYIKVEACDYEEDHTITYFDQNDNLLGKKTVAHGTPFTPAYTTADLTIPEGSAFRGWATNLGTKVAEGTAVEKDLKLYALVTPIEEAKEGKYYTYDLTQTAWYLEDHECIDITNGAYYNNHGWRIKAGGTVRLAVGGKAYIQIGNCQYSKTDSVRVIAKESQDSVTTFSPAAASDGAVTTFFYNGAADTLVLTFANEAYIHNIAIYNVADEVVRDESGLYIVPAGDASSLILTLLQVQKGDRIFLPDGTYDLGEKVLTQISVDSISLIGQSMEGTIIRNAPDASTESIDNTATLYLTGNHIYLQDLTLQNALDYYKANNGRAVALWDKGNHTVCKNVRLLSYQDTYYSNKIGAAHYFEDGEIHGTVDYICGDGSAYFQNVLLYCEKRNTTSTGSDAITASNADAGDKGYVFNGCTVQSECSIVSLGRAWNNTPKTVYLHTTLDYSKGSFSLYDEGKIVRWTRETMNDGIKPTLFGEYDTRDTDGKVLTPESNIVNFFRKDISWDIETVLKADQIADYEYATFFGEWNPKEDTKQAALYYTVNEDGTLEWDTEDITEGTLFLIENGDAFAITEALPNQLQEGETVRAANARGGFGAKAVEGKHPIAIDQPTTGESSTAKRIENGRVIIVRGSEQYSILGEKLK